MFMSFDNRLKKYLIFLVIILLPWLIVYLFRVFGPVQFKVTFMLADLFVLAFLLLVLLFYTASYVYFSSLYPSTRKIKYVVPGYSHSRTFQRCRYIALIMAFLYPVVSLIDFWIVKNASLSQIVALREAEHMLGPRNSLIGALGTLLGASPPIALCYYLQKPFDKFYQNLSVWTVIVVGFGCMFLTGGRNGFFISIVFVFLYLSLFVDKRMLARSISPALSKIVFTLFIIAFVFSMRIFVERFEIGGLGPRGMIEHLIKDYNVYVDIPDYNEFFLAVYAAFVYLVFYISHAVEYLNHYFIADYSPMLSGVYNFPVLARLFDMIIGGGVYESGLDDLLLKGVYLTFPGSLYVDFGMIGSLVMFMLVGIFTGYLANSLPKLASLGRIITAYLATLLIFSPFYSVLGIANGVSFLFIIFIFLITSLRLRDDIQ